MIKSLKDAKYVVQKMKKVYALFVLEISQLNANLALKGFTWIKPLSYALLALIFVNFALILEFAKSVRGNFLLYF